MSDWETAWEMSTDMSDWEMSRESPPPTEEPPTPTEEPPTPAEEPPLMSDPAVTAFLTQQLCLHGGRLPLSEIPKYVDLSPEHIASMVREEAKRFPQPEPGTVMALSPVRLCGGYLKNTCQGEDCGRLHLCRHFILGKCFIRGNRYGKFCRFSHDLRCDVNKVVLKANEINNLREKELRVLLQLNDPSCMPEVCFDYKGGKNATSCHKGDQCARLHVCQHFAKGRCIYFNRCNQSHNLLEPDAFRMMKARGFSDEMIENIQLLRVHLSKELEKEQLGKERGREHFHGKGDAKHPTRLNTKWGSRSDMREARHSSTAPRTWRTETPPGSRPIENKYGRKSVSPLPRANKTVTTYPREERYSNIQQVVKLDVEYSVDPLETVSTATLTDNVAPRKTPTAEDLRESLKQLFLQTTKPNPLETARAARIQGENTFLKPRTSPLSTEIETASPPAADSDSDYETMETNLLSQLDAQPPINASFHLTTALPATMAKSAVQPPSQPRVSTSVNASSPTYTSNLQPPTRASSLGVSKPVQSSSTVRSTPSSTIPTVIPSTGANTVSTDGINASLILPSTASSSNKTTTDSPISYTDAHNIHYSVGPDPASPATITKPNPVLPGTMQDLENAMRIPSNATIDESFEVFSLPGPEQNVVHVYVHKEPAIPEDRGDPNEICFYHIWKFCEKKDKCGQMHYHLPYRWQILKASGDWDDLPWMEDIEKAYSDPDNTRSDKHDINFEKMVSSYHEVRRLCTPSSVTQPADHRMTTEWVWHWKNEVGKWIEYGQHGGKEKSNIASADLETIYLADKEATVPFEAGSQRYEINFKDMIQTNVRYVTQKEVRRRPRFVSRDDVDNLRSGSRISFVSSQPSSPGQGVPAFWDRCALPEPGYKLVEISKTSTEFKEIAQSFGSTMPKYSILKLERIQNVTLWRFYQLQREAIKKRSGKDVLEKKLYHGTNIDHVPGICNSNFDWRVCGLNGTVYGKGSYFARDASYSHNYCSSSASSKTMFLARVLVGDFVSGNSSYVLPPLKPNSKDHHYNSCVDKEADPSIYVVFEKTQIYPEYLIEYDVNSACSLC